MRKQRKIFIVSLALVCIPAFFASTCLGGGGIVGSKHDFTTINNPAIPSDPQNRICVYCHIPHYSSRGLLPFDISSSDFTMYGSTQAGSITNGDGYIADGNGPTGSSTLCVSCHDGESLILGGSITIEGLNPAANIGTDLTNDHPISFVFEGGKAGIPDAMVDIFPGSNIVLGDLLWGGRFECSTCHDTHNSQYDLHPSADSCANCHVDNVAPQLGISNTTPHNATNGIQCMECHSPHHVNNIPDPHPPLLNIHCNTCHVNDTGGNYSTYSAPYVQTHQVECWDCHQNHASRPAEQPLVAGNFISSSYDSVTDSTTISMDASIQINDPVWSDPASWSSKSGAERGLLLWIHYTDSTDVAFEIEAADTDTISFRGQFNEGASDYTFALTYGQSIKTSVNGSPVKFSGPATLADNDGLGPDNSDSTPDGICQVCHINTRNWRADGTGADHYTGANCFQCHTHQTGFLPSDTANCAGCHQDYVDGSYVSIVHGVHLNALNGPQLNNNTPAGEQVCLQCHISHETSVVDLQSYPRALPNACDSCHSPNGAYDGVNDPELGSLNNLGGMESTIYDADGYLRQGKEEWCLTCHDDGHSSIQGVDAPNIAGKTITGTWRSPSAVVETGFPAASDLIDGDFFTGNVDNAGAELIFDMGSTTDVSHVRMYTSGSKISEWEVYGSNDLVTWDRILLGRKVRFSKPYWEIGEQEGWNEYRLDKFIPVRYIKFVKLQPVFLPANNIVEFQYRSELSYGYMVNGHKLACDYCHDTQSVHIDGNARTYTFAANNYNSGYRLSDVVVGAETVPAMEIPRVGKNNNENVIADNDFALCFTCHDKPNLLGDAYGTGEFLKVPLQTNFRRDGSVDTNGNQVNAHFAHLNGRGFRGNSADWDSDWDGVADSPQSCTACHNVHGSPNPAMTRHGELASTPGTTDRVPMFNFQYKNAAGVIDADLHDVMESTGAETQYFGSGPGNVAKNSICGMCHSDKYSYERTP